MLTESALEGLRRRIDSSRASVAYLRRSKSLIGQCGAGLNPARRARRMPARGSAPKGSLRSGFDLTRRIGRIGWEAALLRKPVPEEGL